MLAMKKINARDLVLPLIILILFLTLGTACELPPYLDVSLPPSHSTESANLAPVDNAQSTPPAESQLPVLLSVADVVAKVKPSVVAINAEVTVPGFFGRTFAEKVSGSGWIIDENGVIVTNAHVVDGAESITVTLDDGRTFPVDMSTVATDPQRDLAVLKIDAENLPAADIGDSSALRIGDWVVAIGNSLGLGISATNGIVSGLEVSLPVSSGQTLYHLIQTDAAINPGNSGGPLVNMSGQVIGITSVKIAAVGVEGLGYAISIDEAIPIIQELLRA
jgi:serine protease Do